MDRILTNQIFLSQTVVPGTPIKSGSISLCEVKGNGYFSVQLEVTGEGSLKLDYELSIDGVNYVTPVSADSIVTGFLKTSGTAGKDIISFNPELATAMRFVATATSANIVLNTMLCMQ